MRAVWQLSDGIDRATGLGLAKDGSLLVVDFGQNVVHHIAPDGHFIGNWASGGSGNGQLAAAAGLAVDASGAIYVADHNNYRIVKLDGDGRFVLSWGKRGSADGQFDGPDGIAIGPDGLVYVSEDTNARVQVFDSSGKWIRSWGADHGQAFGDPSGIAFTAGKTFVADFTANKIWTLDSTGHVLGSLGEAGNGDGQFHGLSMLTTDRAGDILATDYDNGRIQKFDPSGAHLATYVLPDGTPFQRPFGLAVGADGDLFVAEYQAGRVSRLKTP